MRFLWLKLEPHGLEYIEEGGSKQELYLPARLARPGP